MAAPDLTSHLRLNSYSVIQGTNLSFICSLSNFSSNAAPASSLGVYIDGRRVSTIAFEAIGANTQLSKSYDLLTTDLSAAPHTFLLKADDGNAIPESNEYNNDSDLETFTVTSVNNPPISNAPLQDHGEVKGGEFSYQFSEYSYLDHEDSYSSPPVALQYSAKLSNGSPWPDWLSFVSESRTFSGLIPTTFTILEITVTATDSGKLSVSDTWLLFGTEPPNQAPIVGSSMQYEATEDQFFSYTIPTDAFSDPDGDSLSYTVSNKPDWLSFDGNNTFSGTAPIGSPDASINITAADPNGGSVSSIFTISTLTPEPVNSLATGTVTINDTTPKQNQILTASDNVADLDGLGVMTYTWFANDVETDTGKNHIVTSDEIGKTIKVTASYIDGKGNAESVISDNTSAVSEAIKVDHNGHTYLLSHAGTWTEAEAEAVSKGGHLVTINDQAEQDWLVATFFENQNLWIGLTDQEIEGTFKWTSGEISDYRNWGAGQPDNSGDEDYVHLWNMINAKWNDMPNSLVGFTPMQGIIEIINHVPTEGNDTLLGKTGDDQIFALAGNDNISTLEGNDTIDGGLGIDTMNGGTGNDTYYVDNIRDVVTETSILATEIDSVYSNVTYTLTANVENLTLMEIGGAINATGNAQGNTLLGNSAANTLDGKRGADIMDAGDGNDIYIVDNIHDMVVEQYGDAIAGIDTVRSYVNYVLSDNIENLTLIGITAINGTGNALKNILGTCMK